MKQTINFSQFCDAFTNMDRQDNFSYEGKQALFDWIEQLDDDCGTETELDVIALCCEFTEYEDLAEFHGVYDADDYADLDAINDHTFVIPVDANSFIIQDF
tara:strand:+ start:333 stop:635 length:303 start_codon:yes stop_codon:yes gene_type:complete